jgi:RimJ/RimL family protein N-acetyltransferase
VTILETERLLIREVEEDIDGEFMLELLNSPKFIRFIGDRNVRTIDDSREFIRTRYRKSYDEHGYGLYAVDLRCDGTQVGICGFVRRDTLPAPDLGFAFLPEHEGKGYGFESASALMDYGRVMLNFKELLAITTLDNEISEKLLLKLEFVFQQIDDMENGEQLKRFGIEL